MAIEPNQQMYLPFVDPRKRGSIRLFLGLFWLPALDSLPLAAVGTLFFTLVGLSELFQGNFSGFYVPLLIAGAMGGLAYWQYKLLQVGTSPMKKLFGMQVLKFDPALNGYRACTAKEYVLRDVVALIYFPVAFAVLSIPAMFGAALSGGMAQAMVGDDSDKHPLIRQENERRVAAAAAAGGAAGVAASMFLIKKFPWILALHDHVMKTMVVEVNAEQAKYFAEGGTFLTEGQIKPFAEAA